jgi:predicted RNase H-like HicB family nuclease
MTVLSYPLVVEWSEEDQVFIGSCPGITGPCCPGSDRRDVFRQLVKIASDWLEDEEETDVAVS